MNIEKELGALSPEDRPARTSLEYHIHMDGNHIGDALIEHLEHADFEEDHFLSPEAVERRVEEKLGSLGYSELIPALLSGEPPVQHYTLKIDRGESANEIIKSSKRFKEAVKSVCAFMDEHPEEFRGYVETEVSPKWYLPERESFYDSTALPFRVKTRSLETGNEKDRKESELHFCTFAEETDARLVKKLYDAGLYIATMPAQDGRTALIFTIQGTLTQMKDLQKPFWNYLVNAGGYSPGAKLTREDIAHWIEKGAPEKPAILESIEWQK
jgi:hypothetical protein